jgi:hypothetical protein
MQARDCSPPTSMNMRPSNCGVAVLAHAQRSDRLARRDDFPSAAFALLNNPCRFSQQLSKLKSTPASKSPVWLCEWQQSHWLPTVSLHKLQTKNESVGIDWGHQDLAIAAFQPSHHTGYAHLHAICPTSPMCSVRIGSSCSALVFGMHLSADCLALLSGDDAGHPATRPLQLLAHIRGRTPVKDGDPSRRPRDLS